MIRLLLISIFLWQECLEVEKGKTFYDFEFNTRLVKSTIVHFQVETSTLYTHLFKWFHVSSTKKIITIFLAHASHRFSTEFLMFCSKNLLKLEFFIIIIISYKCIFIYLWSNVLMHKYFMFSLHKALHVSYLKISINCCTSWDPCLMHLLKSKYKLPPHI